MPEGFMSLKKDKLVHVASEFGVDFDPAQTKREIVDAMEAEGVSWQYYEQLVKTVEDVNERLANEVLEEPTQDEEVAEGERVLVRMTRKNPRYDVRGATFTQEKPFAFLSEDDAAWVVENIEGFRPALQKEVRDFYGK